VSGTTSQCNRDLADIARAEPSGWPVFCWAGKRRQAARLSMACGKDPHFNGVFAIRSEKHAFFRCF
jgi:hypothetical protein